MGTKAGIMMDVSDDRTIEQVLLDNRDTARYMSTMAYALDVMDELGIDIHMTVAELRRRLSAATIATRPDDPCND